jgi:hypothetical protein
MESTTSFPSSENGFKVFSTVPFATKVFRRLLLPRCCPQKLEVRTRKNFRSRPDLKVFFSLDRKSVVAYLSLGAVLALYTHVFHTDFSSRGKFVWKSVLALLGTNRKKYNLRLNPPPALLRKLIFVEEGNNLNLGFYVGIKYLSEKLCISHQLHRFLC